MASDIYTAVYSGVPVYEVMCRGIAVMRRKQDSFLNATQILKVAGIEKGRRTKILEREVLPGEHEKIQGGYGKYQGTWVPFQRGKDLAKQYEVEPFLRALFEYDVLQGEVDTIHSPAQRYDRDFTPELDHGGHNLLHQQQHLHQHLRQNGGGSSLAPPPPPPPPDELPLEGAERYRSILMAIFLNDDADEIPSLLTDPTIPEDLDIDLVIDDQGHTALHWAAALARIQVLELLVQKNADVRRVNHNGESALIRAVLVTNNYDKQSFPHLLSILHRVIPTVDLKNRTMLHHIAMMAGVRGRGAASRYYMECLLEWIARNGGDFASLVDIQDKNGDTALTIAARVGDRYLARFLIDVGANREIENKVGLRAGDFGVDELERGPSETPFVPRAFTSAPLSKDDGGKRGKEVMHVVQKMVDELDVEFSQEIMARQGQLKDTQSLLRNATRELTETRRSIVDYRAQAQQVAEAQQKIKNLSISLEEESQRTRSQKGYTSSSKGRPSSEDIDVLFNVRKHAADGTTTTGAVEGSAEQQQDVKAREKTAEEDLILLRSRVYAYQKNDEELAVELAEAKSKTSANELLCKKVIAICCNIPLDKVDDMLVPLTLAVESDGASLDLSRVAGFMSRVKQQEGMGIGTASSSGAVPAVLRPTSERE
ncbi:transcriptional regulator swi6 [Mortierella sp. 14UC]|nr:transcriptional regulator swi6 [Mortierella sp. 14UC]